MDNERNKSYSTTGVGMNSNAARYLQICDNYKLQVLFWNGVEKLYDMSSLIEHYTPFRALKDTDLFQTAHLEGKHAYAIVWNDYLDLAIEEVWEKGKTIGTAFDYLISMKQATDMWGLDNSTLRKAIQHNRFIIGEDVFKFGKQWVLSKGAVEREYGLSLHDELASLKAELKLYNDKSSDLMQYYEKHPEKAADLKKIKKQLKNKIEDITNRLSV